MTKYTTTPVALTIAGSDSGGGAGVQADLRVFAARGVFGTSALTCITAQNPDGVSAVAALEPSIVHSQIDQVCAFFSVSSLKTGMLYSAEIIEAVYSAIKTKSHLPLVIDPVMVSTSGANLLKTDAINALIEKLFPLAHLITPNLDEVSVLIGWRPSTHEEVKRAALDLVSRFGVPFLVKGGHLPGGKLVDVLAYKEGRIEAFLSTRILSVDTHGSGCTLSAAITAELAKGADLYSAVEQGRNYLLSCMTEAIDLGSRRFINHMPRV